MNYLHLSILVCILIISVLYVNYQLNIVKINDKPFNVSNIMMRYENSLKENFVVNTKQLENEIKALNNKNNNKNKNNNRPKLNSNVKNMIVDEISNQKNLKLNNNVKVSTIKNNFIKEDDSVENMINKLQDMEKVCETIDKEQKIKDDLEQISINKSALQELENQEQRIEELAQIVKHMRSEKEKRDLISRKCRVNKQENLDNNYQKVKALSDAGFLKDESQTLNVNLPESGIKLDFSDLKDQVRSKVNRRRRPRNNGEQRNNVPSNPRSCAQRPKTGFQLSKLQNGVCRNCNVNSLRKDIALINKDFKKN